MFCDDGIRAGCDEKVQFGRDVERENGLGMGLCLVPGDPGSLRIELGHNGHAVFVTSHECQDLINMEEREGHDHAVLLPELDSVSKVLGGEVEDVDLGQSAAENPREPLDVANLRLRKRECSVQRPKFRQRPRPCR